MSAPEITRGNLQSLKEDSQDFYLINYANADMVGHSGDFEATVKAIKCLDEQLERLYTRVVDQLNGTLYITADHGKAENMWDGIINQHALPYAQQGAILAYKSIFKGTGSSASASSIK